MDLITTSFTCYVPHPTSQQDSESVVNSLAQCCLSEYSCKASYTAVRKQSYNFVITGTSKNVSNARSMVLKACPAERSAHFRAPYSVILDSPFTSPTVKPAVREHLDDIASETGTHISVNPSKILTRPISGIETVHECEFRIIGCDDAIDIARIKLLVMLDKLSGLHAESCEVDQRLHYIIAGCKHNALQVIQQETATNIYLTSPLLGQVYGKLSKLGPSTITTNTIWITGKFNGVRRARDMISNAAMLKTKAIVSRDALVLPRKIDWMISCKAEDLKVIMHDNATYIAFPSLGSATSLISVYGDNNINIQRTIHAVMKLACQFYIASFCLIPVSYNALFPQHAKLGHIISKISSLSSAEIVFNGCSFDISGLEMEVSSVVAMLFEVDLLKAFNYEICFKVELSKEYHEFITGKKDGKINKIMRTTNVKVKVETYSEYNLMIEVLGHDAQVLSGVMLLQDELPAELPFYVPVSYHKRIIGVGGRNIQRIMKKYGVYVKFSNSSEHDSSYNVITRTPSKNAINLENLRQAVMGLIESEDRNFIKKTVSIPRHYHRVLLGEKSFYIHNLEAKTNCRVSFPDKSSGSDVVTIFGPENLAEIAAVALLTILQDITMLVHSQFLVMV